MAKKKEREPKRLPDGSVEIPLDDFSAGVLAGLAASESVKEGRLVTASELASQAINSFATLPEPQKRKLLQSAGKK